MRRDHLEPDNLNVVGAVGRLLYQKGSGFQARGRALVRIANVKMSYH